MYRVFISYSHNDKEQVDIIAKVLEKSGNIEVVYDKHIQPGQRFSEIIELYIQHSHVFIPVITKSSFKRGWVHQEIGYARALKIPVIPISIKKMPDQMIRNLHAIAIENVSEDDELMTKALSLDTIENIIKTSSSEDATYYSREYPETRASQMAKIADDVRTVMCSHSMLRQSGGLSSFHLPNEIISHKIWRERYNIEGAILKNDYHCKCQLDERLALEKHVLHSGCKLIINPYLFYDINNPNPKYTLVSQRARIKVFLDFLKLMENKKTKNVNIAIDKNMDANESITLLGNYFAAESYWHNASQGFMHTMFTTHAVAIEDKVERFDLRFKNLLAQNGVSEGKTLQSAIKDLSQMVNNIEAAIKANK